MGLVYKAEDLRLHRFVALKFLDDTLGHRPSLKLLQKEARAASALNHPNICTIYDIGEENGQSFIAMEFLEGSTLQQLISDQPMQVDFALDLAMQTADGLEAAHSKGIIHRDIKPANIFVNRERRAKLLDFGLAEVGATTRAETAAAGRIPGFHRVARRTHRSGRASCGHSRLYVAGTGEGRAAGYAD